MNLELIMCLIGNLMGIYIISRFFPIFFEEKTQGGKKDKEFSYISFIFF